MRNGRRLRKVRRTATYNTAHKRVTSDTEGGKVIASLAASFSGQRVEGMVGSDKKDIEPWQFPQQKRKTDLHGFYYSSVF